MALEEVLYYLMHAVIHIFDPLMELFVPASYRYKDVKGQNVLITGAGSGIGRLMAIEMAKKGANIIITDVNEPGMIETAALVREQGGRCNNYKCDVSNPQQVKDVAEKVIEEVGPVDMLINNAGIAGSGKTFTEMDDALCKKVMEVNTLGPIYVTKAFLPEMKKQKKGHVVFIASIAGMIGNCNCAEYCASKFAVMGLVESLQYELMREGLTEIAVTRCCPYFINTGLFAGAGNNILNNLTPQEAVDSIIDGILTNQLTVIVPRFLGPIIYISKLFGEKTGMYIYMALGGHKTMDAFTGRNGSIPNGQPIASASSSSSTPKEDIDSNRNNLKF